jgi:hypothetical protein
MNVSNKKPPRRMLAHIDRWHPEMLRGRPPEMMTPLFRALVSQRGLLTWLLPGIRTIGVPRFAHPDVVWLTMVDDLDPAAAGPGSFDTETIQWWAQRAEVFIVDAMKPHTKKYLGPAAVFAQGRLVLVVQTPEARREEWHQFFREVRDASTPNLVMDFMNSTVPGAPHHRLRMGSLGTEFPADAPFIPTPRSNSLGSCWPGNGNGREENPQ